MLSSLSMFDGDDGLVPHNKICMEEVFSIFHYTNIHQISTETHTFIIIL